MSDKPRPEAAAAAWWASRLGRARHDLGRRDDEERELTALGELHGSARAR